MNPGKQFQGSLFAEDYLRESIVGTPDWQNLDDTTLDALEAGLREVFARFPTGQSPNESQTEDDLIWPVLDRLGWTASLRQQNLSVRVRADVPDGLLFADESAKTCERPGDNPDDNQAGSHHHGPHYRPIRLCHRPTSARFPPNFT